MVKGSDPSSFVPFASSGSLLFVHVEGVDEDFGTGVSDGTICLPVYLSLVVTHEGVQVFV